MNSTHNHGIRSRERKAARRMKRLAYFAKRHGRGLDSDSRRAELRLAFYKHLRVLNLTPQDGGTDGSPTV